MSSAPASLALEPPNSQASTSGCQPLTRPLLVRMLGKAVSRLLAPVIRVVSTPDKLAHIKKQLQGLKGKKLLRSEVATLLSFLAVVRFLDP